MVYAQKKESPVQSLCRSLIQRAALSLKPHIDHVCVAVLTCLPAFLLAASHWAIGLFLHFGREMFIIHSILVGNFKESWRIGLDHDVRFSSAPIHSRQSSRFPSPFGCDPSTLNFRSVSTTDTFHLFTSYERNFLTMSNDKRLNVWFVNLNKKYNSHYVFIITVYARTLIEK